MLPNSTQELTALRAAAQRPETLGRHIMHLRDYVFSAVCGLAWHVTVTLLVFWERASNGDLLQFLPGAPAGMVAGITAGALTIRSRRQGRGREQWRNLALTYVAAVATYSVGLAITEFVLDGLVHGHRIDLLDRLLGYVVYGFLYAGVWAFILIPLSYLTRRVVWRVHVSGCSPTSPRS